MLLITTWNLREQVNRTVHCFIIIIWYWEVFNLSVFTMNYLAPGHYCTLHTTTTTTITSEISSIVPQQTFGWSWLRSKVLRQSELWFIIWWWAEDQSALPPSLSPSLPLSDVKTRQMSWLLTTREQMLHHKLSLPPSLPLPLPQHIGGTEGRPSPWTLRLETRPSPASNTLRGPRPAKVSSETDWAPDKPCLALPWPNYLYLKMSQQWPASTSRTWHKARHRSTTQLGAQETGRF